MSDCEICKNHEAAGRVSPRCIHKHTIRGLIEGLQILERYIEHSSSEDMVCAQEEALYVGSSTIKEKMTAEEVDRLEELGWTIDEEFECWHFLT